MNEAIRNTKNRADEMLRAENLSFCFGGEPLLNDVTFSVAAGDFVAIVGSNGAGKSTLLRLILGELSPQSGRILLFGEDISRFKKWPRIGYVPQVNPVSGGSFPATVEEVVCASLYSNIGPLRPVGRQHKEKALAALALVGMRDFSGQMISELSGGQLQRVMLARALAPDCEFLILDEPTTGIDSESADKLYGLLRGLNERGLTVMMVTHDTERAALYVGRTLCLEEGSVVELGQEQLEQELKHRHKHPHRRA